MSKCAICWKQDIETGDVYLLGEDYPICAECARHYRNLTSEDIYVAADAKKYFKSYNPWILDSGIARLIKKPDKDALRRMNPDGAADDDEPAFGEKDALFYPDSPAAPAAPQDDGGSPAPERSDAAPAAAQDDGEPSLQPYKQPGVSALFYAFAMILWFGGFVAAAIIGAAYSSFGLMLGALLGFFIAGSFPYAISCMLDYLARMDYNLTLIAKRLK